MYMTSTLEAELDKVSERVSISDNEKFYVVKDDPRIEGGKATDFHRVSTMLSVIENPALRKWMMNIALDYVKENFQASKISEVIESARKYPDERKDTAANYGTRAHALAQQLADGTSYFAVPPDLRLVAKAWHEWASSVDLEIIKTEQSFYWRDNGISFAGTADLIARRGSTIYIVDYKTGGSDTRWSPYPEMALQLGAYSLCLEYCTGIPVQEIKGMVVKLPKDAPQDDSEFTIKYREVADMESAREAFLHACSLKKWQSDRGKWKKQGT